MKECRDFKSRSILGYEQDFDRTSTPLPKDYLYYESKDHGGAAQRGIGGADRVFSTHLAHISIHLNPSLERSIIDRRSHCGDEYEFPRAPPRSLLRMDQTK